MTREEIEQRIATINNEMTLIKSNYAKLEGHLAEAQHWLSSLTKPLEQSGRQINDEVNIEDACEVTQE